MSCPNSTESGCRCEFHHPGLMAYSPNSPALEAALAKLRPVLRVVTMPTELDADPCDGSFTCGCKRCIGQRAALMHQGTRDRPQPWDARKRAA